MLEIRDEQAGDVPLVHEINALAFQSEAEANLVDVLRENVRPLISLVVVENDRILGHIMFTPVGLGGDSSLNIMGLAPMAVAPDQQRRGIGSALVKAGLERCRDIGAGAVVVLGHPTYYPRFGFVSASTKDIGCEYDVPDGAFMIIELIVDYLAGAGGTISYHETFAEVS